MVFVFAKKRRYDRSRNGGACTSARNNKEKNFYADGSGSSGSRPGASADICGKGAAGKDQIGIPRTQTVRKGDWSKTGKGCLVPQSEIGQLGRKRILVETGAFQRKGDKQNASKEHCLPRGREDSEGWLAETFSGTEQKNRKGKEKI